MSKIETPIGDDRIITFTMKRSQARILQRVLSRSLRVSRATKASLTEDYQQRLVMLNTINYSIQLDVERQSHEVRRG